jgi:hypothetical protein
MMILLLAGAARATPTPIPGPGCAGKLPIANQSSNPPDCPRSLLVLRCPEPGLARHPRRLVTPPVDYCLDLVLHGAVTVDPGCANSAVAGLRDIITFLS